MAILGEQIFFFETMGKFNNTFKSLEEKVEWYRGYWHYIMYRAKEVIDTSLTIQSAYISSLLVSLSLSLHLHSSVPQILPSSFSVSGNKRRQSSSLLFRRWFTLTCFDYALFVLDVLKQFHLVSLLE